MAQPDPGSESTISNSESDVSTHATVSDETELVNPIAGLQFANISNTLDVPLTPTADVPAQQTAPLPDPGGPVPPAWLSSARNELLNKYPTDRFDAVMRNDPEWRIKCLDCPAKLYAPGPGESLSNFEVHLKNREHRRRVGNRLVVADVRGSVNVNVDTAGDGT